MCYFVVPKRNLLAKLEKYESLLKFREEQFQKLFGSVDASPGAQLELNRIKNIIADVKHDLDIHQYYDD